MHLEECASQGIEDEDLAVYSCEDSIIPGRSFSKIAVMNEKVQGAKDLIVEGHKDLLRKELVIPSSVINFHHCRGEIWVTNGTSQSQMIPEGMLVGNIGKFGKVCGGIFSIVVADCREIRTNIKIEDICQDILSLVDDTLSKEQRSNIAKCLENYVEIFYSLREEQLNRVTKKDVYPIPRTDDVLDSLKGANFYSSMDLRTEYWRIEIDDGDQEKTAFITPDGLYEFRVMPFGLCNAPATFERMVDNLLAGLKWTICLCYLDDIIVYASSFKEHLERLEKVLKYIHRAGLCLNLEKCIFGSKIIGVLGHLVSEEGIRPDPGKIEAITNFPTLKNTTDVRTGPFQRVGIDLLGRFPVSNNGNKWIVVATDYLSRYAMTRAIPNGSAEEVAKFIIENISLKHGAPRELISDRGRTFISRTLKEINDLCGTLHRFTSAYHPQTKGLTERLNTTLADMLSMYVNVEQRNWNAALPYVTFAYNTSQQENTGFSPFYLIYGRDVETPLDTILAYRENTSLEDYVESDWPKWIRRFERFRQASGLINNPENEQVNMLVYCMGDNADDILLSCKIASDQLENYNKVIECFESHFIPRRNIIYERARFNKRCQQEGEKVNEFITALHSLAEHCNFGMLHDELIRDRIVVGVRDRALSERMQLDTDLTLVKATLMAKQLESVKEQQSSLYQQNSVDQIKKMPNHIKETKRHEPKIRQFKSNQLGGSSHGCTRCGNSNNHDWKNCPAMNSYCSKCKKKGHYAKVCRSEAINEIKSEIAFLGSVEDNSKKWIVPIKVNNRQINFKIDTGADVNVLPLQYYYQSFQRIKLEKSDKILQGPNGIPLETVGMIHVKLQNKGQHLNSKIYIVDKLKQPLLSGETSEKLNIVRMIQQLSSNFLNPKREFPEIFNGLGHAKINYKISLQPDAKPYALCTPRRVPIPLMKQVKEQLEEMTRLGVIESVEEPTEWCAGMVAVSKPGGKIRICVDLTKLNQYIRRENYPLPATEHILGQLGNACYFSKLDANSGFWQFGLAKESQKLTTFITPFGRFFFKRIPFGITSAPEIFQRKMTQLLGKIEGVVCFMDDIVIYGSSLEEHNERVRQVLKKIQEEGMTLNPEKCQFGVKTVKFPGHTLSSEGLFIDEEKLDAITKMEAPRSTKELKSFLGMVNYLGKFIPNLADKLQPLNSLLSTKNEWVWDEPQKKSFNLLKQETTIVSADASSFGLGGVLRQEQPNGSLKPIAYVSRTLSETEKRYSQIEKEGLAIVWTCDRLKDYVTGIKIHIETDHKPLIAIFTSKS
ncbi:K02A2.6-like [Cordylochernes scorpioides]|uniref:RNA-directed DNA polymerase n=1 Tax=Cordylochernes scorpioides TaxID=51811 RepID=A0ABY6L1F6_9ARAC|nr:K02A2.6-like [Cordylochernes scorpioides]